LLEGGNRKLRTAVVGLSLAAVAAVSAIPAAADSAPPSPTNSATPTTVTADALPTVQINGVAWAQLVVGNTVYVAGQFTRARPAGAAPGASETVRNNMLAYNLTTGALISGFNANLNGGAYALAAAPDGSRIYVGGDFTRVGSATRNRIAAVNPSTGAVISSFAPSVNSGVRALQARGSFVYLGGSFTSITAAGRTTSRAKLARVTTSGAVDTWNPLVSTTPDPSAPTFSGRVNALQLSPTGDRIVIAGSFTHLNGSNRPGYGLGMVSTSGTGRTNLAMNVNNVVRNAREDSSITSLASDGTYFYGTGYIFGTSGNLEGAFSGRWSDTNINWIEDCHGDSYGVYPSTVSSVVYVVGHPHYCANLNGPLGTPGYPNMATGAQRMVAFSKAATGRLRADTMGYPSFTNQPAPTLQNYFPQMDVGSFTGQKQAAWAVSGSGKYVVVGGEFPRVNGVGQQGLVRFATSDIAPNRRGPRLRGSSFPLSLSAPAAGQVRVAWTANYDYDNSQLTYRIYRNGSSTPFATVTGLSTWWQRPAMSYVDTRAGSGTKSYVVRATDRFGVDVAVSATASITSS
jgi:hypothetical protein